MAGIPSRGGARPAPARARAHRWVAGPVMLLVVALTGATGGAPKAFAYGDSLPCTSRDSSAVFARWLDPAQYFQASNGGFEQGDDNWGTTGDAAVVAGNESFDVAGPDDGHSLSLDNGATAEMRTACVGLLEPTVRLFVKAPRVLGARLRIDATVYNPTTGLSLATHYVVLGDLAPGGWAPTPPILIPNLVGGLLPQELTLRVSAEGTRATWGVDDVYVDPFRQR
jgi:hypothetical protein